MQRRLIFVALVAVLAMGCTGAVTPVAPATENNKIVLESLLPLETNRDYHSFAKPDEARVEHVDLDLAVDFSRRILTGSATLRVAHANKARRLILDTRDLDIESVRDRDSGAALNFELGEADDNLGAALIIALPQASVSPALIEIRYRTSPAASGLQWLEAPQTAGKKRPFLFTQSQAIHARSWIPLQDTPAVRVTYTARIRTDADLLAVMSAANDPETPRDGDYEFSMPQPIPAYLIALGVGDLEFKAMSGRTGVFAEPPLLDAAANEFADTEQMLRISEELYGPYRWGRYDLLILPPSFPFGGMENPRLSFITPTVIAGDRSLVALIAHELAHSWSGNLVTNATWRDLWLNEGFTSFLTNRIMEAVYGERRAEMEYYLDVQSLQEDLDDLPDGDEILAVDMRGRDPDDVFSDVPYVKGQLFLTWLESRVGRETFDVFLRNYFDTFAFKSITTEEFLAFLDRTLLHAHEDKVSHAEVEAWVYGPGLPADSPRPYSDAFVRIDRSESRWLAGTIKPAELGTEAWSVHEWLYFLNNLPDDFSSTRMSELDAAFGLTASRNNEIAHSWLRLAIRHGYAPAYGRLDEYLVGIGRRKLIVPLYEELMKSPAGAQFAREVYARARPGYHPLAVATIDAIVTDD